MLSGVINSLSRIFFLISSSDNHSMDSTSPSLNLIVSSVSLSILIKYIYDQAVAILSLKNDFPMYFSLKFLVTHFSEVKSIPTSSFSSLFAESSRLFSSPFATIPPVTKSRYPGQYSFFFDLF